MPRPSDPSLDPFEADLAARLRTWRNPAPPAHLKPRIAATIASLPAGRTNPRRLPALAWGACALTAAALGALLLFPGSLARPRPAFAEVEKAMEDVENVSCVLEQETTFTDGTVEKMTTRMWLRRHPPAIATLWTDHYKGKDLRKRALQTTDREITLNELTGEWTLSRKRTYIAEAVRSILYTYTRPGTDGARWPALANAILELSPWRADAAMLGGQRVWHFTRTVRRTPYAPHCDDVSRISLFADVRTHLVVRSEILTTTRNTKTGWSDRRRCIGTDFRYNEPAPPGTFDLVPPVGKPKETPASPAAGGPGGR